MAQVRVVQWSASSATLDLNLALTTALNKLRTFCNNNAANYADFTWSVGVDLATGAFTFLAHAAVYPNTYPNLQAAIDDLGGLRSAYQAGRTAL